MNQNQNTPGVEFFGPVMSRAELEGVVPAGGNGLALDKSKSEKTGYSHGAYFFIFMNGAWIEDSVQVAEQESYMMHGSNIDIRLACGKIVSGTFTVIKDRPIVFQHPTKVQPNFSTRFYNHER